MALLALKGGLALEFVLGGAVVVRNRGAVLMLELQRWLIILWYCVLVGLWRRCGADAV